MNGIHKYIEGIINELGYEPAMIVVRSRCPNVEDTELHELKGEFLGLWGLIYNMIDSHVCIEISHEVELDGGYESRKVFEAKLYIYDPDTRKLYQNCNHFTVTTSNTYEEPDYLLNPALLVPNIVKSYNRFSSHICNTEEADFQANLQRLLKQPKQIYVASIGINTTSCSLENALKYYTFITTCSKSDVEGMF